MTLGKILVWPVILVFGLAGGMWWHDHWRRGADAKDVDGSAVFSGLPGLGTEGRWLVDEVARDIAEIILFAIDPKADPTQALVVNVTEKGYGDKFDLAATGPKGSVSQSLKIQHHVWSPSDHRAWAAALLEAWQPPKSSGGTAPDGAALARKLTDPTTVTLIREERQLSALLNKQPLDPELNEQAALVIGTFALREAAGHFFTDVRGPMCRLTAHLALARALRPEPGLCGQLAEAIQLTLAVRQAEALERVAKLPAGLEPWITALKIRNTGDWRLCPAPAKASFLEQTAWARAVRGAVDATPLLNFVQESHADAFPDWGRIALEYQTSVQQGHVFARPSMALELADLATAWKAWSGLEMKESDLMMVLNDPARRAIERNNNGFELNVLGWGQFGAQHQRHLCNAIVATDYFLRHMWGVPDRAEAVQQMVHTRLSDLRFYPFIVRLMMAEKDSEFITDPVFKKAMRDAVELCNKQPQLVTAENWALLSGRPCRPMPAEPPAGSLWFQPSMPQGTDFDFDHRIYHLHLPPLVPNDHDYRRFWDNTIALAPYEIEIIRSYVGSNPSTQSPYERDRQAFNDVSAFNIYAMERLAGYSIKDARAYADAMKTACELKPDLYLTVAAQLQEAHLEEEAAAAYQAAFDKAPDRVWMANNSDWIVNYYFDHGRKDDALKIALHAAEVYSLDGLETAGKLMERMEKWKEAFAYYAAIAERYDDPACLLKFMSRNKERDPTFAGALEKILVSVFPDGMKQVTLSNFQAPPQNGSKITEESRLTQQWKLKKDDVIVALDGVRVESFKQYDAMRSMQPGTAPLALIVWDGTRYREVNALVPDRKFGCGMETYEK